MHKRFQDFFEYLDAQKLRTPKAWTGSSRATGRSKQMQLMLEMQGLRFMPLHHVDEGVREIVPPAESLTSSSS